MNFTLSILDPFELKERTYTNVSAEEALVRFGHIDWAALNKAMYERQEEVQHYYYFYEIISGAAPEQRFLTISPDYPEKDTEAGQKFIIRYEYPDPVKQGARLDYVLQQQDYAFARQSLQAFLKEDRTFFLLHFETARGRERRRGGCFRKLFLLLLLLGISGLVLIHFVIGWNHVPEHLRSLRENLFPSSVEQPDAALAETATANVDVAEPAPEVLSDTVTLKKRLAEGAYAPGGEEALQMARSFNYAKLQPATEQPSDAEAEQAILHFYKERVGNLLDQYHAHIRIGKAYKAPLQESGSGDKEIARVTAMVCAFDNKGINLGNIQMPLDIVYDFVQYASEPGTWYLADISQTIPYDKALNK